MMPSGMKLQGLLQRLHMGGGVIRYNQNTKPGLGPTVGADPVHPPFIPLSLFSKEPDRFCRNLGEQTQIRPALLF